MARASKSSRSSRFQRRVLHEYAARSAAGNPVVCAEQADVPKRIVLPSEYEARLAAEALTAGGIPSLHYRCALDDEHWHVCARPPTLEPTTF